jgi:isocitrate lyase
MGERETIAQLRNRLPDAHRLGDDRAESLIQALAEERNAMHREAVQQGVGSSGFGFGAGMIFTTGEDASFEDRYATAKQNSQRMRDRAAQYLNAEQMRAFNEMQDETLLSLRSALRQKEMSVTHHADGISYSSVTVPAAIPAN